MKRENQIFHFNEKKYIEFHFIHIKNRKKAKEQLMEEIKENSLIR